jgi:glycosyltransferase involved in cell wall biosynthesis
LERMELGKEIEIVILGMSTPTHPPVLPLRTHYLGFLRDELSLALVYAAVDVFVATPLQDNLPNAVVEASACGVPSAGFSVGGIPDIVEHQVTGCLVRAGEVQALAYGIHWILEDVERWRRLSQAARSRAVRDFDQECQARRYLQLYEALVEEQKSRQNSKR